MSDRNFVRDEVWRAFLGMMRPDLNNDEADAAQLAVEAGYPAEILRRSPDIDRALIMEKARQLFPPRAWPEFTRIDPHMEGPVQINPANVSDVQDDPEGGCLIRTNATLAIWVKESRAEVIAAMQKP